MEFTVLHLTAFSTPKASPTFPFVTLRSHSLFNLWEQGGSATLPHFFLSRTSKRASVPYHPAYHVP
jgi:hypothetical protein